MEGKCSEGKAAGREEKAAPVPHHLGTLAESAASAEADLQALRTSTSATLADMDNAMSRLDAWQAERGRAMQKLLAGLQAADAAPTAAAAAAAAAPMPGIRDPEDIVSAHTEKRLQEQLATLEDTRRKLERRHERERTEAKCSDAATRDGAVAGRHHATSRDTRTDGSAAFAAYMAAKRARNLSGSELAKLRIEAEQSAAEIAGGGMGAREGDTRSAELRELQAGVRRLEITQLEKAIMRTVDEEQRGKGRQGAMCREEKCNSVADGVGGDGDNGCRDLDMKFRDFNRDLDRVLRRMDEVAVTGRGGGTAGDDERG